MAMNFLMQSQGLCSPFWKKVKTSSVFPTSTCVSFRWTTHVEWSFNSHDNANIVFNTATARGSWGKMKEKEARSFLDAKKNPDAFQAHTIAKAPRPPPWTIHLATCSISECYTSSHMPQNRLKNLVRMCWLIQTTTEHL
jgi:hypothetical protein